MNPLQFYNELREIALQADNGRLSVLWPVIETEYPEVARHVRECINMENSAEVLNYLAEQNAIFAFLKFAPQAEYTIEFILKHFREKDKNGQQESK